MRLRNCRTVIIHPNLEQCTIALVSRKHVHLKNDIYIYIVSRNKCHSPAMTIVENLNACASPIWSDFNCEIYLIYQRWFICVKGHKIMQHASVIDHTQGMIRRCTPWHWGICSISCFLGPLLLTYINTLRPRQNGRHFADDTFKRIFMNENVRISTNISLKFVPKGLINNIPESVQLMTWRRPEDKPLSEPMMVNLLTHICVTRPQWVDSNPSTD